VGAVIAVWESERPGIWERSSPRLQGVLSVAAVAMFAVAIFFYSPNTLFPGLAAVLPVAGAALLVVTPGGWVNRRLLSSGPMVFIGLVSYSWYLWHWPLLSFARILSERISVPMAAGIGLLSFLLAIASHRLVETPFRKTSNGNSVILRRYAAVAVAMALPLLVMLYSGGWPARYPGLSEVEASGGVLKTDPCLAGYGKVAPNLSAACAPAGPANLPAIALVGDSHAAALAGALRQLGAGQYRLLELTKVSCPALTEVTRFVPAHPRHDSECAAFNRETLKDIHQDATIKVVILAGFWSAPFVHEGDGDRFIDAARPGRTVPPAESRENLKRGLQDTVELLQSYGKRVIVLKDSPAFDFDPVRRVRERYIRPRLLLAQLLEPGRSPFESSEPRQDFDSVLDKEVSAIIDEVAAAERVDTFDLKKTLCDANSCYFYDGKSLLYEDSQHLSLAGAERGLYGLHVDRPLAR
jgi:hypothetical protein